MFVIKKLRLNKFQPRPIVGNRAHYLSVGDSPAKIVSKDTSECFNEPCVDGASKNKLLGLAQAISSASYAHHKGEEREKLDKSQKDL